MQAIGDQLAIAQSDIAHHLATNEALLRHNEELQADLAAKDGAIDEAQVRLAALLRHSEQLQADLAVRDGAMEGAQEKLAALLRHNEQLQADLTVRDGAMGDYAATVARQQEELASLHRLREQQHTQGTEGTEGTGGTDIPQESKMTEDDVEGGDGLRIVALMAEIDVLKSQRDELSVSLTKIKDELAEAIARARDYEMTSKAAAVAMTAAVAEAAVDAAAAASARVDCGDGRPT